MVSLTGIIFWNKWTRCSNNVVSKLMGIDWVRVFEDFKLNNFSSRLSCLNFCSKFNILNQLKMEDSPGGGQAQDINNSLRLDGNNDPNSSLNQGLAG